MRKLTFIGPVVALLGATAAGPASGAPHSTTVSLDASVGSRQFFVEDLTGSDLTSLNIDRDGAQPFRVRVKDTNFGSVTQDYQIDATLNNLYKDGDVTKSKIPSSAFKIGFGASKLAASGVSFPVEPSYLLSGTIEPCATLVGLGGALATLDPLSPLCILLGTTGQTVTDHPVAGAVKNIVLTASQLKELGDLPVQLAGATGGTFTNADYKNGIGAGDASGNNAAGTAVGLMAGTAGITTNLLSIITGALPASSTALTTADDVGSRVPLATVISTLSTSSDLALSQLGQAIGALGNATQQSAVINRLTGTLVTPTLSNIKELTGTYSSFPILTAAATAPEAGTYKGTMTVTFVQTP